MNLLSALTLIFITLKLTSVITWSWWLVLMPSLIEGTIFILILFILWKTQR